MFNKSLRLGLPVILLVAGVCLAQEKPGRKDRPRERENRSPRLNQVGLRTPEKLVDAMKDELKLTDSQQSDAKRLVDAYTAEVKSLRDSVKPSPESGAKYADLRKQMEEARKANDTARQQQIVEQMKEDKKQRDAQEGPVRESIERSTKNLHDQLAQMLSEKQRSGFEALWQDALEGRAGMARVNPARLKAQFMKLAGLTDDQKKQAEELFKAHEKTATDAKNNVERERAGKKLYEDVLALLNPDQKQKLQSEMEVRNARPRPGDKKSEPRGG